MILKKSGQIPATHLQHKTNTKSDHLAKVAQTIETIAQEHQVNGLVGEIHAGVVITTYTFELRNRTPKARVKQLEHWLAKALFVPFIQITKQSGRNNRYFVEVPNQGHQGVQFLDLVEHSAFPKAGNGALAFGVDAEGKPVILRLQDLPHLLVVGNNTQEKGRLIHSLLFSLRQHKSSSVRMLLIDPKMSDHAYPVAAGGCLMIT